MDTNTERVARVIYMTDCFSLLKHISRPCDFLSLLRFSTSRNDHTRLPISESIIRERSVVIDVPIIGRSGKYRSDKHFYEYMVKTTMNNRGMKTQFYENI